MKTYPGYLASIILLIFSAGACKKDNAQNVEKTIPITVVEYKSNLPVIGALVEYYKSCNCFPGGANLVLSKKTGDGGICEIPESIFNNQNYGILITPPSRPQDPQIDYEYWPVGSSAVHSDARKYELPILGDAKLHLKKVNDFPKGDHMDIKAQGEQSFFQVLDVATVYGFPSDSSFIFYSYRSQTCKMTWDIYDSANSIISSGALAIDIPKTGVQEVEIKY